MNAPAPPPAAGTPAFPTFARLSSAWRRWALRVIGLGLGATILYVLSMGPLIHLNKRGLISPQTIEKVYFPLSFLADIPGFNGMLDRYIRLWVPEAGPEQGQPE